ncbi:MAG: DnaD domain protein [Firmicutes bacterium]|nr:DnaD domain protein [Bacillota bacterium]MDY5531624.1 DnaD domain protein [Pumilibacteraceae bacterium]
MQMKIGKEKLLSGKTEVDNAFLLNFMPFAPESYVKVYLCGLLAASGANVGDNAEEYIASKLSLDTPVVEEALRYWENQGVIAVSRASATPEIEFLPVREATPSAQKFSKTKYKDFNDQLHAMLPNRNVLPSEYNEYYSLMEDTHMETGAMLAIIAYCIRQKGESISYPYILAVARNLAAQGLLTFDRVSEQLSQFDEYEKELRPVLAALGSKRKPDHEDKRLYIKWTKGMEYTSATIIKVAKTVKKGGMEKLDALMTRYYENHLMSFEEIEDFNANREKLVALAKNVNRIIGVYYEQLDFIIETYITKWIACGFDEETITLIATYCFKRGVRTLEGMNDVVDKFYKQGLVSAASIDQFVGKSVQTDNFIKAFFEVAGITRNVTSRDRDSYNVWTGSWGMTSELITLAAEKSKGTSAPVQHMNTLLSAWFKAGVKTVDEANAFRFEKAASQETKVTKTYTSDQLNALFDNLEYEDL